MKKKTIASIVLAILMVFSTLAFVFMFFPSGGRKKGPEYVELKPVYENLSDRQRYSLLYEYGLTLVHYPSKDSFFNSTLSKLPNASGGYISIVLDRNFSIESADGMEDVNATNWMDTLCRLMVKGSLPDCLERNS